MEFLEHPRRPATQVVNGLSLEDARRLCETGGHTQRCGDLAELLWQPIRSRPDSRALVVTLLEEAGDCGGLPAGIAVDIATIESHDGESVSLIGEDGLPVTSGAYDRVVALGVLDRLPDRLLAPVALAIWDALEPCGRFAAVGITRGRGLASRLRVARYEREFSREPSATGGRRPMLHASLLVEAGFFLSCHEFGSAGGLPAELVVGVKAVPFDPGMLT